MNVQLGPNEIISLRALEPSDIPALQVTLNRPELAGRRYVPDGISDFAPLSARQVESIVERWQKEDESWTLAVVDTPSGNLAGYVRADWEWDPHCPSVCVVIAPERQRQGLGSAALDAALAFLFEETPAHVVSGWASSWNESALGFALRNGFREAGRRPRGGVHRGAYFSEVAFDLLRVEWKARKGGRHAT